MIETTPLRVLIAHSRYRQRGGEDIVAEQEAELLERHGHAVLKFTRDNQDIDETRPVQMALQTIWSTHTTADLNRLIGEFQPDVIHVHNTFPLLSPSLYWAAARHGVPIVQTLHNFRLLCPQAMLLRDGNVCEDCVGRIPWRAVVHGCYRESITQSAVLAGMLATHRSLGTYKRKVARYIALNEFCRSKFISGGLQANKIVVKPNFADLPDFDRQPPESLQSRCGGLFVGRFSHEKGVSLLLDALAQLSGQRIEFVGDGPERQRVANHPQAELLGWLNPAQLIAVMRRCSYLVLPSIWYENSPRTLIEAFGCGLPVIASRLGALAELVEDGRTGLLFEPNSVQDLTRAICWAEAHPDEMRAMGHQARQVFNRHYTPEKNYEQLIAIYREAIESQYSREAA